MQRSLMILTALSFAVFLAACDQSDGNGHDHGSDPDSHAHSSSDQATPDEASGGHAHADGTWHAGSHDTQTQATPSADTHAHADGAVHAAHGSNKATDDHAGAEIGTVTLGDIDVQLTQGHGVIAAGKESHLVVRLPYTDNGQTVVRAWIGTQDRTLSFVGRADYNSANNAYDIHAVAPKPLLADAKWWIEIEKPDGTRVVGSATPITE